MMPGDPSSLYLETGILEPGMREAIRHMLGLDKPLYEQYIIYLKNTFTFTFGVSFLYNEPAINVIISRKMLNTLALLLTSHGFSIVFGIMIGVWSAWRRGRVMDISSMITAFILYSLPVFWVGMVLLLMFSVKVGLFPLAGTITAGIEYENIFQYIADYLHHLVLPATAITLIRVGGDYLITRNTMITVIGEDYIKTALAKGVPEKIVVWKHAARNAVLPLITWVGLEIAVIFSGAVLTETVFSWDGIGKLIYDAALWRDYPVLEAAFFIIIFVTLVANFLTDLAYAYLDPRVKYD
jgi:peptide/nickel transport system permease protein